MEEFINCCSYEEPEMNQLIGIKISVNSEKFYINRDLITGVHYESGNLVISFKIKKGIDDFRTWLRSNGLWDFRISVIYGNGISDNCVTFSGDYNYFTSDIVTPTVLVVKFGSSHGPVIKFYTNEEKTDYVIPE